jgi:catechol 2,3-dioxygenase-like lactoylglutathione lyase family enzyme
MKHATKPSWMPAPDYGRSLKGLGINLLVREIEPALDFAREVLNATVVHSDPDFAVLRHDGAEWMLHADHTYSDHPLTGSLSEDLPRGIGAELRLHGRDPDDAEAVARKLGYTVLDGTADKPHGLREVYILDPDGYLWVPDVALPADQSSD